MTLSPDDSQKLNRDLLQQVLDVSRMLAETRALTPLLDRALEEAVKLVGAERGYLVMVGSDGGHQIRLRRHRPGDELQQSDDNISNSIVDKVVKTGEPLILRDALNDPEFSNASSIISLKLRSVMCVPLISRGSLIGALYVENRSIRGRFRESDLPPLILFANQAAVAIENAALNEELEQRVIQRTRELQDAMNQLEGSWMNLVENNRMQTELLGNVAHDLRSPLTIVVGTLSAMEDGSIGPVTAEQREWITKCLSAVTHVLNLTNDIFDLTKLDLGKLTLYVNAVDLYDFMENIYRVVTGLPWPGEVALVLDAPKDLPPVLMDAGRIRQILFNLISNALKYTSYGNVTLHARHLPEQNEVWIGVSDSGDGIAPDQLLRLFQRFQQADDNVERRRVGTGLGLAISKQLVEMHGGRIWAESTPGQGSNFVFALPTVRQE
jgi:signal transduction histidine kinase